PAPVPALGLASGRGQRRRRPPGRPPPPRQLSPGGAAGRRSAAARRYPPKPAVRRDALGIAREIALFWFFERTTQVRTQLGGSSPDSTGVIGAARRAAAPGYLDSIPSR